MNPQRLARKIAMANTEVAKSLKEYTGAAKRVLNYLCGGATPTQAAEACGVDKSYVSQLMSEEDFQTQVAAKLTKDFETAIKIDANYTEIEEKLSDKLKSTMPYLTNADQIARILKTVSSIPKKVVSKMPLNGEGSNGSVAPVTIAIPVVAKNVFLVSPNSEVVKLDGRDIVTLNSKSLNSLLKERREQVTIEQSKPVLIEKPNGKHRSKIDDFDDL